MKTKIISLAVLSLAVCTLAIAADYKSPNVGFKEVAPSHKESTLAEFSDEYKVEGAKTTDRQIASEKEPSDREPSSIKAQEKKAVVDENNTADEKYEPKPWLYRNKLDAAY